MKQTIRQPGLWPAGRKILSAVMILAVMLGGAPIAASIHSDAASGSVTIDDSGYVEDRTALFYYAKFATGGFHFTKGSVSNDTPDAGIGGTMKSRSIYASISGMDPRTQYYVSICEYASDGERTQGVVAKLETGAVQTFVYMSVVDGIVYTDGKPLECSSSGRSFSEDVSSVRYELSVCTGAGGDGRVAMSDVRDPSCFSSICAVRIRSVGLEDGVANLGKSYGYTTSGKSQAAYAGRALSYPAGDYLCIFFLTNIASGDAEVVVDGGYRLPASEIKSGANVTSGYYYAAIPASDLEAAGFDIGGDHRATVGKGGEVFAEYPAGGGESGDGLITAAVAAAAIIALIAVLAIYRIFRKV